MDYIKAHEPIFCHECGKKLKEKWAFYVPSQWVYFCRKHYQHYMRLEA